MVTGNRFPGLKETPLRILRIVLRPDGDFSMEPVLNVRWRHEMLGMIRLATGNIRGTRVDPDLSAEVEADEAVLDILEIRAGGEDEPARPYVSIGLGEIVSTKGLLAWAETYLAGLLTSTLTVSALEVRARKSMQAAKEGPGLIVPRGRIPPG